MVILPAAERLNRALESADKYREKFNAVYFDMFNMSVGNEPIRAKMVKDGMRCGFRLSALFAIPSAIAGGLGGPAGLLAGPFAMMTTLTLGAGLESFMESFNSEARQKARIFYAVRDHRESLTKSERENVDSNVHDRTKQLIEHAESIANKPSSLVF